jgi:choline dehydrogenase-like flavoprotein
MSIVDLSSGADPGERLVDVCVIGSGSGGATAARLFAEAGKEVLCLEEGGDRTGTQLTQRGPAMYDQLYMDRGGRATSDLSINVMQGRVLGGGGVINAADVVPIPEGVLEHWQKKFGLTDFTHKALARHEQAALKDLSAVRIREDQVNRANQKLRQGTEALGWRGELMMTNRQGCIGLGTCLIGCPINAKQNPRFVAIPKARAAGAEFWLRARAVRISDETKEIKRVQIRALDPKGYHELRSFEVRAKAVVVAANAVATPQLLLRSGIGNEHVGRHLSLQPQLPLVAMFDETIDAFDGIPQAWAVTEFEQEDHPEHGLWGYRIEAVMGTPGIVSTILPSIGHAGMAMMRDYGKIAASLLLLPDAPTGRVRIARGPRPKIDYAFTDEYKSRARDAVKAAARIYLAAGAREVIVPVQPPVSLRSERDLSKVDGITFQPASAPFISAHQQGGVRFAPNERDGAAAPDGQVYGTRGVYVFDSSGYPSSASSHTMTPIITTSRFLASQML